MFRMKQIGMVAMIGLALVLATATVSLVPVQHASAGFSPGRGTGGCNALINGIQDCQGDDPNPGNQNQNP